MKVKDVIERLSTFNQEAEICVATEEEILNIQEITDAETTEGEEFIVIISEEGES